jgi:hypothetical protein
LYAAHAPLTVSGQGSLVVAETPALPSLLAADLTVTGQANVALVPAGSNGGVSPHLVAVGFGQTGSLQLCQNQSQAALPTFNGDSLSTAPGGCIADNWADLFGSLSGKSKTTLAQAVAAAHESLWGEALALALSNDGTTCSP